MIRFRKKKMAQMRKRRWKERAKERGKGGERRGRGRRGARGERFLSV